MSDYAEDRFHESLDAALGRAGERDVEALVAELGTYRKHGVGLSPVGANTAARAVLASDWLAQRIEQAKAEGADLGRRATLDPGHFVKRGPDNEGNAYGEDIGRWQKRAIEAALGGGSDA